MKNSHLEMLMYLLGKCGLFEDIKSSTIKISKDMNYSQQTISRRLREMENLALIKRNSSPNGITIRLDQKGRKLLEDDYAILKKKFENAGNEIEGIIKNGIGEGKYYMSLEGYKKQFKEKLGFSPYPGTLNIISNKEKASFVLSKTKPVEIRGFKTKDRTYGSLICYNAKIKNISGAVIIPERGTHPKEIIEIIAPVYLRSKLHLKEGGKLKVSIC